MSTVSEPADAPTKEQRFVLRAIYRFFFETGIWPKLADIDKSLRQRGINAALVIRDTPQTLLRGGHRSLQPQPDTELTLTLAGLAQCPGSADDISLFLRALRSLVRYESRRGPATTSSPVIVTSRELRRAWRLPREQRPAFIRACRMLLVENWGGVGTEPHGDSEFEFRPTRETYRFRAVRSAADYYAAWRQWDAEQTFPSATWNEPEAGYIEDQVPMVTKDSTPPLTSPYVADRVRAAIVEQGSISSWHVGKLTALIDELNANYAYGNGYASHMLLRAILDHVPPALKQLNFAGVANNHGWSNRTDKNYVKKLLAYKLHGDDALHRQISRRADSLSLDDLPPARAVNRVLEEVAEHL